MSDHPARCAALEAVQPFPRIIVAELFQKAMERRLKIGLLETSLGPSPICLLICGGRRHGQVLVDEVCNTLRSGVVEVMYLRGGPSRQRPQVGRTFRKGVADGPR